MQPLFDAAWQARTLAGDAEAVGAFVQANLEPLYAFCLYRVGRKHHLCEEVVHETLLRAIHDLAQYDPARSANDIFPWLTGLARNEIHRALAHTQHSGVSLEALWANMDAELLRAFAHIESENFGDELLERQETRELVNLAMSQLPPQYRVALEAKYVAGQSVREIAHMLKTSEKAVESQLTRARAAFRATFTTMTEQLGKHSCLSGQ